jgi:hypothetical protein
MLFNSANHPYWIFIGMGLLLFALMFMVGGGDGEMDGDGSDGNLGLDFLPLLLWLGIGRAPLIPLIAIDVTLVGVMGLSLNTLYYQWWGQFPGGWFKGIVGVSAISLALILGGILSFPVGRLFSAFGDDVSSDRLLGCTGQVASASIPRQSSGQIGQVDVVDLAQNQVSISAALPDWSNHPPPQRGDTVIVIAQYSPGNAQGNAQDIQGYLVVTKDSPDYHHWLTSRST